ncbi:hypothetical protein ACFL5Q_08215 [Planctomycetota bacterium]
MGLDFVALLKCPDWDKVIGAVQLLERESPPAVQKVREVWNRWGYYDYNMDETIWEMDDCDEPVPRPTLPAVNIHLVTREVFRVAFGARVVRVYHVLRWPTFLTEPEWRETMLAAVRAFADLLGAAECILTSDWAPADTGFTHGLSFDKCLALFRPEAEAAELSGLVDVEPDDDTWDYHGYWRLLLSEPK